jgi:hypothetical protein
MQGRKRPRTDKGSRAPRNKRAQIELSIENGLYQIPSNSYETYSTTRMATMKVVLLLHSAIFIVPREHLHQSGSTLFMETSVGGIMVIGSSRNNLGKELF